MTNCEILLTKLIANNLILYMYNNIFLKYVIRYSNCTIKYLLIN